MLSCSANPCAVVKTRKPVDGIGGDPGSLAHLTILADFHIQATGKRTNVGDGGTL